MIPVGIEEKYEVVRTLHESAATVVLLVRHREIGALRVLKAIQRSHPDAESILSEANLLSEIQSIGIPTIYDLGKTKNWNYLVEEYVEGQSLREHMLEETAFTMDELINIAVSICDIVDKLHTAGMEPVLYRDMKPEHVMLSKEGIKLIDFGIAVKKSQSLKSQPRGTASFAAPEQQKGQMLDERCDVYGIGMVIKFMLDNSGLKENIRLRSVISKATDFNREKRTGSVAVLREELKVLLKKTAKKENIKKHLDTVIAVAGSDHGAGSTHLAIKLCQYANMRGATAYYRQMNGNQNVRRISENIQGTRIRKGVLYHRLFSGIMEYGPAVEQYAPPEGVIIRDYGKDFEPKDEDLIIYVVGSSPWQNQLRLPQWVDMEEAIVVYNRAGIIKTAALAKALKKRVYRFPVNERIFQLKREEIHLLKAIWGAKDFDNKKANKKA